MNTKYLFLLFIFCFIIPFDVKAESTVLCFETKDTIPNDGYFYDTITVFDRETYEETTVIYRTKIEGYRYDTIMIFDLETYEETIKITKVPYGSEKELVEPETEEDEMKKLLACYQISWGPLVHNYVFGSPNRIYVNPKMVDEILETEIKVIYGEDCDAASELSLNIMVQYDNGDNDAVVMGVSGDSRKKIQKNKRRTKDGTIFRLDRISITVNDEAIDLPYIQFVVKK